MSRFSSWLEGATGHQLPSRQRDSNTAGMNLTQGCFLNRESSTWAAAASIAQFTSRLPWRGCDRGCQERETQAKRCLQGAPSWDGRTHTGGKEKHSCKQTTTKQCDAMRTYMEKSNLAAEQEMKGFSEVTFDL